GARRRGQFAQRCRSRSRHHQLRRHALQEHPTRPWTAPSAAAMGDLQRVQPHAVLDRRPGSPLRRGRQPGEPAIRPGHYDSHAPRHAGRPSDSVLRRFVMGRQRVTRFIAVCSMAACLLPRGLAAQAVTGTILGVVTDDTGAMVPGATVTLTHNATGRVRTFVTDAAGEYTAPSLPTGQYTVVAELSGFKKVTLPNVDLGVDQRVRVNVRLEVGAMSESVTITGSSPLVQTSSSELGTTVQEEQIKTLPLNGRNFVSLTR